ncbi:MAG TPA: DUF6634 family protein [Devosia sp.]|nr:DUF6634 family protein [Devosia sp.]
MSRLSRETLAVGLRAALRIQQGELPTEADLAAAPHLDGWAIEEITPGLSRLIGVVSGHPKIADGWCTTSVLLVLDRHRKFARTASRLYRLGKPLGG